MQSVATIKDVAKEAGVAVSTVYNVLNSIGNITEETKLKVLQAAKKLKYIQSGSTKSVKSTKKVIGVFISSMEGEFYNLFLQSIYKQSKSENYNIQIFVNHENTSEEIYNNIINSGVTGAIILNRCLKNEDVEKLAYSNIPIVFCDKFYNGINISSIIHDNYGDTVKAIEYLIRQGHKKIGFVHGEDVFDNDERFRAYKDVMKKYNLPILNEYVFRAYFKEYLAYAQMMILLKENKMLPDAMFCANDEMACGCIKALKDNDIDVPRQVSIVGYDEDKRYKLFEPNITTIYAPIEEIGRASVCEVLRLINSEELIEGKEIILKGELIVKDSSSIKVWEEYGYEV